MTFIIFIAAAFSFLAIGVGLYKLPPLYRSPFWVVMNFVGMALFIYFASDLWAYPGQAGEPGGPGDSFYFFFFLAPILAAFSIINFVALITIVRRMRNNGSKRPLAIWIVITVFWLATVTYDFHKTYRVIDEKYSFTYVTSTSV